MLTRNKKLKDYGIPAEDIEKLNAMLKDFPAEYGYLLSSAALSACPKNTVIADMVIENILHRKSYRKISKERYIPMNPKDFYGYRRKTVAVLYERMRLLGVWEDEYMKEYRCPKCNSKNLFVKKAGNNTGLYCGDCGAWIKWIGKNELRAFEYLTKQKHVDDASSKQDDIASIIYGALDHMYCDNCRFSSEIKESDSDEWNCDECHRKYNGWGVSMQESNRIAKEILKQLGE